VVYDDSIIPENLFVSEERNWFKELLEWLHHAYWIWEFLISVGLWGLLTHFIGKYSPIVAEYKPWLILLLAGASIYTFQLFRKRSNPHNDTQGASASALSASTNKSALTAGADNHSMLSGFDSDRFFHVSYVGPLSQEVEKNMRFVAHQKSPNDVESFYLRFIGVGLVQAVHDNTWWPMFKSQLEALLEINRKQGIVPIAKVKEFYDAAAAEYPEEYKNDPFDRWLSYLIKEMLVIRHPSEMIEITVRGKDFLKYLTHWGREPKNKRL